HIPLRRGLGSSAAAVVGGLMAGQELLGRPLSPQQLLGLATELEGHPDNVAPALMGGCQVVVGGSEIVSAPVPLPRGLVAALFIPDFEIPTREARAVLPQQVSRADAVYNVGRAALLVAALATGQLGYLRIATQDRLHQPARQALFPAMERVFQAALEAGALGVFLSGSGSTILALVKGRASPVAQAMARAAREAGVKGRTKIARPSLQGAAVV
ncbi:MAG: homoserine kinase, partial [Chloroflexota bacterium]|nr:homoserine kinase [Chloroflexota bacterium]